VSRAEDVETALLGAPRVLTRDELLDAVGVTREDARSLWMALGFPAVPPDEPVFTEHDVAALRATVELRTGRLVEPDAALAVARAMGQHLAALAEAQVEAVESVAPGLPAEDVEALAETVGREVVPVLQQLVVHVWQRHFAAAAARALAVDHPEGGRIRAVGFVDLVGFTGSSRRWDATTLARTLDRFERDTARRVAERGGRVVKTLGDAVMYVVDDAAAAAQIALETVAAHAADADLPQVRAGVALGPVVQRVGDVFGGCVNLASRLTGEAHPSSVLVDDELAAVLQQLPAFAVRPLKPRPVRGYRALRPWVVTAAGSEVTAAPDRRARRRAARDRAARGSRGR